MSVPRTLGEGGPLLRRYLRASVISLPTPGRLNGQTRWPKALVRLGADPGLALARVLGVAAGDIRVRVRAE